MSTDSDPDSLASLRRPLLIQRAVLTVVLSVLVMVMPFGPNRFFLAATIVGVQIVSTWIIGRKPRDLIDELGAYLVVQQALVVAAGVLCPKSYFAANMLAISSLGVNAPYLTVSWLRRIVPVTMLAAILPAVVHDIDDALPIICITTLLSLHMTFNRRSGAVLLAAAEATRAQHEADHDPLTGLANRRVLVSRLDQLEPTTEMGLLLIDLNGFKEINDTYGHEVGDTVLRAVADRLVACGDAQLALRLGGDEFAMMVPGAAHETEAIADLLLQRLTEPITIGEAEVCTGASIGMAHTSTASAHELLRFADVAMFSAKRSGTGRAWYTASDDRGGAPGARRARRDWRGRTAPR